MRKSRFRTGQIIGIVKEYEAGMKARTLRGSTGFRSARSTGGERSKGG
jgi:hypothetical protein